VCREKDDGSQQTVDEWREATRKGAIKKAKGGASRFADPPARSLSASSSSASLRPLRSSPMARRQEVWLAWALFALACVYGRYWDLRLPRPLPASAPASVFSEARALALAGALESAGPRVAGSSAEARAFDAIESRLRAIQADADATSAGAVVVDVTRTTHAGQFALAGPGARGDRETTMAYAGLTVLAIRVRDASWDADDPGSPAAMLAAHVDTVHVSPGGSDNGLSVAVAVETARAFAAGLVEDHANHAAAAAAALESNLSETSRNTGSPDGGENASSSSPLPPPAPRPGALIAAFVSAEEDGFKGAHAFATSHPWMTHARRGCVLNLESMGAGGPHRMFQVTRGASSDALLRLWSRSAPRPSGTVIASDIFASGLISSDTDHRIWRDVGDAPGFDFAFLEKTRDYHTPRDALRNVRSGTAQAAGENLLAFVRAFSLKPPERKGGGGGDDKDDDDSRVSEYAVGPDGPGRTRAETRARRSSETPAKRTGATWFAPPGASYYVVFSAPGPAVARLFYALGAFATLQTSRLAFARSDRDALDVVRAALAAPLACAGVLGSGLAAALAGGFGVVLAGKLAGDVPGASQADFAAFVACSLAPAATAQVGVLALTRRALTALRGPSRAEAEEAARREKRAKAAAASARRKKDDDAGPDEKSSGGGGASKEDARKEKFLPAYDLSRQAAADWTLLASHAGVSSFAAARLFDAGVGGAYLFALAALAGFATAAPGVLRATFFSRGGRGGESSSPGGLPGETLPSPVAIASAFLAPAFLAFPPASLFAEVMHGMTARSRPASAIGGGGAGGFLGGFLGEFAHEFAAGVAVGAGAAFALAPIWIASIREEKRDASSSSSSTRGGGGGRSGPSAATSVVGFCLGAFVLALAGVAISAGGGGGGGGGAPWTRARPALVATTTVVDLGADLGGTASEGPLRNASKERFRAAVILEPAGPGHLLALADAIRARDASLDARCEGDPAFDAGAARGRFVYDLATYGVKGRGACFVNDGSAALVDDALHAVGIPIAVEEAEEAEEAEEDESSEAAAGEDPEDASSSPPTGVSSPIRRFTLPSLVPSPAEASGLLPVVFRAGGARRWFLAVDATCVARVAFAFGDDARTPPVGPWRATALGRAGGGAGAARYAASGTFGFEESPAVTAWLEARAGGVLCGEGGRAAVIARVEYDAETETARRTRVAAPDWVEPFAKFHLPLKTALVVRANVDFRKSGASEA
jgi:hypothetical protein